MKAIIYDREASKPLLMPPEVTVAPDSAITPPGRPVFLPDFDSEWVAEFYLAIKVTRLGKDISEKFAPRYFDQATIAMRLVPITLSSEFRHAVRPSGIVTMFDNALTLGQWIDVASLAGPITAKINDSEASIPDIHNAATLSISSISRYCTLKTGDLVMPYRVLPGLSVKTGTLFTVSLGDAAVLSVKIH